jgi:hypothetical protein
MPAPTLTGRARVGQLFYPPSPGLPGTGDTSPRNQSRTRKGAGPRTPVRGSGVAGRRPVNGPVRPVRVRRSAPRAPTRSRALIGPGHHSAFHPRSRNQINNIAPTQQRNAWRPGLSWIRRRRNPANPPRHMSKVRDENRRHSKAKIQNPTENKSLPSKPAQCENGESRQTNPIPVRGKRPGNTRSRQTGCSDPGRRRATRPGAASYCPTAAAAQKP